MYVMVVWVYLISVCVIGIGWVVGFGCIGVILLFIVVGYLVVV